MTSPTDLARAEAEKLLPLIAALKSYQQADEEGVMVLVSRQACEEAAQALAALMVERDAEWNRAMEVAAKLMDDHGFFNGASEQAGELILALRRPDAPANTEMPGGA